MYLESGAYDKIDLNNIEACSIEDVAKLRARMLHSLLFFTRVFFELRTGHEFRIGSPDGHESHYITMSRALMKVFNGEITMLPINIPPRYGKSEMLIHFVAWAIANYPDCNFLYICYSKDLATTQTSAIRNIISHPVFKKLFCVELNQDTSAKDDFITTGGGHIIAAGSTGTITGHGAGIRGVDRFGGCIIIDDLHKPDDITSDSIRNSELDGYDGTIKTRRNNGVKTPVILIGQRLHEGDIFNKLLGTKNSQFKQNHICLPAITNTNHALCPDLHSYEDLKQQEEENPYHFWAQMMQNPQPAGGGLYKKTDFVNIELPTNFIATFIVVDSAETSKTYNDATAFSFFGVHYIEQWGKTTDVLGLCWLDAEQIWVEPKDLEANFIRFYYKCCQFKKKPQLIAIEKKSTGSTLISLIKGIVGTRLLEIERGKQSGSKTQRFIDIQTYIAKKLISFPINADHALMCREHMSKITANGTHLRDDLADTCYDGIKLALIDKILFEEKGNSEKYAMIAKEYASNYNNLMDWHTTAYLN